MVEVSACGWSLPGSPEAVLARLSLGGFRSVDLWPSGWHGISKEQIAKCGLRLRCAGVSGVPMPPGLGLESLAGEDAGRALPYYAGAIERAGGLGAEAVYMVTPQTRLDDQAAYARSIARLADVAARAGVKLCLEPHPGRLLSTAAEALEFVERQEHENVYSLIDLGHTLISGEEPAGAVRAAGERLGYVHIDDNDGRSDLHLPLFQGVLRPAVAEGFLDALGEIGYGGSVGIELKPVSASPLGALVAARDFVEGWRARRGV